MPACAPPPRLPLPGTEGYRGAEVVCYVSTQARSDERGLKRSRSGHRYSASPAPYYPERRPELRELKGFDIRTACESKTGFIERLLSFVLADMRIVASLVEANEDVVAPWTRNKTLKQAMAVVEDIQAEASWLAVGFDWCRHANTCRSFELCPCIHVQDATRIALAFQKVQNSANKLIFWRTLCNGSALMRALDEMRLAMWHVTSRRASTVR